MYDVGRGKYDERNEDDHGGSALELSPQMPGQERGQVQGQASHRGFFDSTSSTDKGRHRASDPRDFDAKTLRRIAVEEQPGITILTGVRKDTRREQAVTVLFNRQQFDESAAFRWWVTEGKSKFGFGAGVQVAE